MRKSIQTTAVNSFFIMLYLRFPLNNKEIGVLFHLFAGFGCHVGSAEGFDKHDRSVCIMKYFAFARNCVFSVTRKPSYLSISG